MKAQQTAVPAMWLQSIYVPYDMIEMDMKHMSVNILQLVHDNQMEITLTYLLGSTVAPI